MILEKLPTNDSKNDQQSSNFNRSKNTGGHPSISFRRKESSENQIKELFITSPMVSSPDFDKQHNLKSADNKDNLFCSNYYKWNNYLIDTSSDILSPNSDISSVPRVSASKINALDSNQNNVVDPNLNYKMVIIFIRSLTNFMKSCKIEKL